MRQLRRSLTRWALHLLVMVSFIASVSAAGRSYFFCGMLEQVQSHCCCSHDSKSDDGNHSIETRMGCCELRTNATPDTSAPTVSAPVGAADLFVSHAAPVALVPRAPHVQRAVLADWTGPPLDQRRALTSVRLL